MTTAEFLRAELAPTPARVRSTLRVVAATLVIALAVMAFHVPHGYWAIFTAILVGQGDAGATIRRALERVAGTLVGGAAAILAISAFSDQPWFLVPLIGVACGLSIYGSRRMRASYAALLAGITFAILMPALTSAESSIDGALWRILMISLGAIVGTAAQLLLWPIDPEAQLIDDFAAELARVGAIAARAAAGAPPAASPDLLASTRLGRQLDLLTNTESRHPVLRRRHAELAALMAELDRLLAAALWLARSTREPQSAQALARLAAIAAECTRLRDALIARRPPAPTFEARTDAIDDASAALPAIIEMERALAAMPASLGFLGPHPAPRSPLDVLPSVLPESAPVLTLAHRDALRDAIRVGIASVFCVVLVYALAWPAISTCIVTCVVVAQGSAGASVRKGVLRIAGAVLGGLLGLVTVVFAIPNLQGVIGWLLVFAFDIAVAAWIATGGPRIAYAGVQTALALCLYMTDVFGPTTQLEPGRDRVIGIAIGIAVKIVLDRALWPTDLRTSMRQHLAAALRRMAELSRIGLHAKGGALIESTGGLRRAVYEELAAVLALEDDAWAETGASSPAVTAERRALLDRVADTQEVFLALLAIARHRIDVDLRHVLGDTASPHLRGFALTIGTALEEIAQRIEGSADAVALDLAASLERGRVEALQVIGAMRARGEIATATHLEARLTLYDALTPALLQLARDAGALNTPALPAAIAAERSDHVPA